MNLEHDGLMIPLASLGNYAWKILEDGSERCFLCVNAVRNWAGLVVEEPRGLLRPIDQHTPECPLSIPNVSAASWIEDTKIAFPNHRRADGSTVEMTVSELVSFWVKAQEKTATGSLARARALYFLSVSAEKEDQVRLAWDSLDASSRDYWVRFANLVDAEKSGAPKS